MSQILYEQVGATAVVTINRPEKLNALAGEMLVELTEMFRQIAGNKTLRAVVLTGAGDRAFSAGTDLGQLIDVETEEEALRVAQRGQHLCDQIERTRVPVIAAVNGIAAGAGCELALACHLRVAASNASFSLPELKLGIIPGYGGTQRLAREIGSGRALEIILTARPVPADEALRLGLINRVAESDARAGALELAREVSQLAPLAIRSCIEAVTRGTDLPLNEGLQLEAKLFAELFATKDMREGTRAFLEKRKPEFTGE